ncbi:hypothetical protein H0H93_014766 [Arthromyces matolae]|nr:hypothetical protein H0H93_014766 [Arthromyces matolae]
MAVYTAIIRGVTAGEELMHDRFIRPVTTTMDSIHGISNTTPGAIATTAMLAIWALSGDSCLQQKGKTTKINYMNLYNEYLEILTKGLRKKLKSVREVVKEWDTAIFPDTETSLVMTGGADRSGVTRALAAQDEEGAGEGDDSGEEWE